MTSNDPREASVAKCTCGTRVFQIAVQWARRVSLAGAALLSSESTMHGVRVVWVRFRRRRLEQRSAVNEPPVYLASGATLASVRNPVQRNLAPAGPSPSAVPI